MHLRKWRTVLTSSCRDFHLEQVHLPWRLFPFPLHLSASCPSKAPAWHLPIPPPPPPPPPPPSIYVAPSHNKPCSDTCTAPPSYLPRDYKCCTLRRPTMPVAHHIMSTYSFNIPDFTPRSTLESVLILSFFSHHITHIHTYIHTACSSTLLPQSVY
ncbi:hypothetical protein LZ31DRAFT_558575, partial [Colletotrichum somersetense]